MEIDNTATIVCKELALTVLKMKLKTNFPRIGWFVLKCLGQRWPFLRIFLSLLTWAFAGMMDPSHLRRVKLLWKKL